MLKSSYSILHSIPVFESGILSYFLSGKEDSIRIEYRIGILSECLEVFTLFLFYGKFG